MGLALILPLHRATHQVALFLAAQDAGVTQAEAHALAFLAEHGGAATLRELHRSFGHRRSTLTGVVDRLEGKRLLRRAIAPRDRRSFLLRLTPRGRLLASRLSAALGELEAKALAGCRRRDVEGFHAVLAALEASARAPQSARSHG
jgi:DNA-binding MarR family transcriptional regulator